MVSGTSSTDTGSKRTPPRLPRGPHADHVRRVLWKTSGHWDKYRDNMYIVEVESEATFALKPMNCPATPDLRQRAAQLPRPAAADERSRDSCTATRSRASLHGLMRVRPSRRTTPTCSAPRPDRGRGDRRDRLRARALRPLRARLPARALDRGPRSESATTSDVGPAPSRRCRRRSSGADVAVRDERGRRRLLRAEDRRAPDRRDRPRMAAGHGPARLQLARAVRPGRTPAPTTTTTGR